MCLALLCATSVILKIIELANCTRSQAVIDEGFGFLSPPCTCSQNVAPLSYRLISRQRIQESWGGRSRIVPVTVPEVPASRAWGLWEDIAIYSKIVLVYKYLVPFLFIIFIDMGVAAAMMLESNFLLCATQAKHQQKDSWNVLSTRSFSWTVSKAFF